MTPQAGRLCASLAVIVVLVLAWAVWSWLPTAASDPTEATLTPYLLELFDHPDPSAGRLTRGPAQGLLGRSAAPVAFFSHDPRILLEVDIERRAQAGATSHDLHALGLLRLFQGRFDDAIEALRRSVLEAPERAEAEGDLASAYLLRASHATGDAFDTLLAAEASARALALDPDLQEARYNLALALHDLGLTRRAEQAWNHYLELDAASEWADVARARLEKLHEPTDAERWAHLMHRLDPWGSGPRDQAVLAELSTLPFQSRREVEERLLPEWAEAVLDGEDDRAGQILGTVRVIAEELRGAGDRFTVDVVESIRSAARQAQTARLPEVAVAHRDAGLGLSFSRTGGCEEAEPLLRHAQSTLRDIGSPLAEQVALRRAVCLYPSDANAARQELLSILERSGDRPYPTLLARALWMLGLCSTSAGDYATALAHYLEARELLGQVRDDLGLAGLQALIVEAHRMLGQHGPAWRERLTMLPLVARTGESRSLVRALEESVDALVTEGRTELAALFQDELLARSAEWEGAVSALPSALLRRAGILQALGKTGEAVLDLDEASRLADLIPEEPTRARLRADIDAARGRLLGEDDPMASHTLLTASIDHYRASDHRSHLPGLLAARASASLALGDASAAERDLFEALRTSEVRRRDPDRETTRVTFFEGFQPIYESMVRYQLESRRDPGTALAYADRARGRALLDRMQLPRSSRPGIGHPPDSEELVPRLQAALPTGVAVIEYAVFPEKLLIWVVTKDELTLVDQPSSADRLSLEVRRLREAIRRRAGTEDVQRPAGALFDALVRPAQAALREAHSVVVIPDRSLHRVPFAALFDRESGSYWIEQRGLALAPSASLLLATGPPSAGLRAEERSVLVVADPAIDRERFPDLGALPGAAKEGQAVARIYPRAELLTGPAATPEALLRSLPGRSVLHLATHVVVDDLDPAQSLIALAPGREHAAGGALPASALPSIDLSSADVAFLSACSTATLFPGGEREGVAGLAREVLAAGVPSVIGSLWDVDDEASLAVSVRFHRSLAGGSDAAAALRAAVLGLLNGDDPEHRSPGAWSAFQLYTTRFPNPS